jgi:hypothetical protein
MIKRIKLLTLSLFSLCMFAAPIGFAASVSAQATTAGADIQGQLCSGTGELALNAASDCGTVTAGSADSLNTLITNVVNVFSIIVGIIAVIMIIIGGFKYITSGGDSGNVTGAKNTILYAIVGLVIVALAQFVVKFVLAKATGATG